MSLDDADHRHWCMKYCWASKSFYYPNIFSEGSFKNITNEKILLLADNVKSGSRNSKCMSISLYYCVRQEPCVCRVAYLAKIPPYQSLRGGKTFVLKYASWKKKLPIDRLSEFDVFYIKNVLFSPSYRSQMAKMHIQNLFLSKLVQKAKRWEQTRDNSIFYNFCKQNRCEIGLNRQLVIKIISFEAIFFLKHI